MENNFINATVPGHPNAELDSTNLIEGTSNGTSASLSNAVSAWSSDLFPPGTTFLSNSATENAGNHLELLQFLQSLQQNCIAQQPTVSSTPVDTALTMQPLEDQVARLQPQNDGLPAPALSQPELLTWMRQEAFQVSAPSTSQHAAAQPVVLATQGVSLSFQALPVPQIPINFSAVSTQQTGSSGATAGALLPMTDNPFALALSPTASTGLAQLLQQHPQSHPIIAGGSYLPVLAPPGMIALHPFGGQPPPLLEGVEGRAQATTGCSSPNISCQARVRRAYKHESFPQKLYRILEKIEEQGKDDIISFIADGTAFEIHQPDAFQEEIIPLYFRHQSLPSFRRQLGMYGFKKIKDGGPAHGGYAHELFVRGRPYLCRPMKRIAEFDLILTRKGDDGD